MICPICHQPALIEWPHAHAMSEKDQKRMDEDLARRINRDTEQSVSSGAAQGDGNG